MRSGSISDFLDFLLRAFLVSCRFLGTLVGGDETDEEERKTEGEEVSGVSNGQTGTYGFTIRALDESTRVVWGQP
jgi:hypothetical protein